MGVITNISVQQKHKDRVNLYIDNEFYMGVSVELVYKFALKKGMEVDNAFIDEIVAENEKSEALSKAIAYTTKNLKTEKQVKTYLFGKEYQPRTVFYVIDKLKEYKLIDDEVYSKRYLELNSGKQGERMSRYKLKAKGIKEEDINAACDQVDVDFIESAKNVAEKHLKNKPLTKENLSKTYRYLLGKGFSFEQVNSVMENFKVED